MTSSAPHAPLLPPAASAPDFAAVLCSRLCHDLIGPVGAVLNGCELLEEIGGADASGAEPGGDGLRTEALDLIRQGAASAAARLQVARLAFGARGGTQIAMEEVRRLARAAVEGEAVTLDWRGAAGSVDAAYAGLLLNMVLLGMSCLPGRGVLNVEVSAAAARASAGASAGASAAVPRFTVCARPGARLRTGVEALISGVARPDAHGAQPALAGQRARRLGRRLEAEETGGEVRLSLV